MHLSIPLTGAVTPNIWLQSLGLLGDILEPEPVAKFLRHCPGLSKQMIGDLLGENDQFFLDVLDAFTATFQFRGELYKGKRYPVPLGRFCRPQGTPKQQQ